MRDGPPQLSRVARQSAAAAKVQLPLPLPLPLPPSGCHHRRDAHRAVSAAGRPQQPRPHHRHRARGTCGARPRDRSPRDARRHRGAAPHRAVPGRAGRVRGEVWITLSGPAEFQIDLEVGKQRVGRRRVRLAPPRRWTLYWLSSSHTDVGYTDRQERCLEVHRANLDAALARLADHPEYRWTAECALQVLSYVENRSPAAGQTLAQAIRDGKVGFSALFANLLTGILDHETLARAVWPAGWFAREQGLGFRTAQIADVPGQVATLPTLLAASGVRYLVSGVNPERTPLAASRV